MLDLFILVIKEKTKKILTQYVEKTNLKGKMREVDSSMLKNARLQRNERRFSIGRIFKQYRRRHARTFRPNHGSARMKKRIRVMAKLPPGDVYRFREIRSSGGCERLDRVQHPMIREARGFHRGRQGRFSKRYGSGHRTQTVANGYGYRQRRRGTDPFRALSKRNQPSVISGMVVRPTPRMIQ